MENLNIKERERVHFRIGEDVMDSSIIKNPKDIFEMGSGMVSRQEFTKHDFILGFRHSIQVSLESLTVF